MKSLFRIAAFAAGLLVATGAMAASALVTTDLNIRTGPSTGYPAIGVLPNGAVVDVVGCTRGYSWCRVNYRGYDGWASSRYLAQQSGAYGGNSFGTSAAAIGIPLIAGIVIGNALNDDDDHWDDRHYWRDRDRWDDRWDRRARREWREDRREWRRERREARREWREERREARRERREERREDRRDRPLTLFEERRWMDNPGGNR